MLRAALILCLAGCLETPTGKSQAWPIPGNDVVAAIGADVDGDGKTDAVIAATGVSPGIFLALGGKDLVLPSASDEAPIRSFAAYHPRELEGAVALAFVDGAIIVASAEGSRAAIERLTGKELASSGVIQMAEAGSPNTRAWLHPIMLQGPELAIGTDDEIYHFPPNDPGKGMSLIQAPSPPGTWATSQLATTANNKFVVALGGETHRSVDPPPQITWELLRDANLDGAGGEELVGYSNANQSLCSLDLAATAPAALVCGAAIPADQVQKIPVMPATQLHFAEITGTPGADILAVLSAPAGQPRTVVAVFETIELTTTLDFVTPRVGTVIEDLEPPVFSFLAVHESNGGPTTDVVMIGKTGVNHCDPGTPSCQ
jgi:hypothetical protein